MKFEWDPIKALINQKKHKVSFNDARTAFLDPNARLIDDPDHSKDEDRFILLGISENLQVLVVCHCYRKSGQIIRIISARKADRDEQKQYVRFI